MVAGKDHSPPAATAAARAGPEPRSATPASPAGVRDEAGPPPTVAIDGPSGAGKSTVARELARRHGWRLVDTGAMYRALTWAALRQRLPGDDPQALTALAESLPLRLGTSPDDQAVFVADEDVTAAIRTSQVTKAVSAVSAVPGVRRAMLRRQRELAAGGGVVVEGRDIGTTVLPDADLKVFLTATEGRRAARRSSETGESHNDVASAIATRDRLDSSRPYSPLQQASDAVLIDSSNLSIHDVVERVERALDERAGPTVRGAPWNQPGPATGIAPKAHPWGPVLRSSRWLAQRLVRILLRVRIVNEGRIPAGAGLLAGNHTGFLDGPLVFILLRRPSCFLAKAELFDGFWTPVLRWCHQIPVHRGQPDRAALRAALAALADGQLVGMFPEGTRGEGKLETIQDGVGYIAAMSGCPVVPVVCRGTARALPRGRVIPRLRTRVDIVFGEPFRVTPQPPLRRADVGQAAAQIADQLRRLVDEAGLE